MSRYVVEFQRTSGFRLRCNVFLKLFFFTEINVGGCKLAGIGGAAAREIFLNFFPSEIDLGGLQTPPRVHFLDMPNFPQFFVH